MNRDEFIRELRATAAELQPLTRVGQGNTKPDPFALSWWSILRTIASLIEAQETELTPKQIAYLNRELFGGMGSLLDLSFDPVSLGEHVRQINQRLAERTSALFKSFKG